MNRTNGPGLAGSGRDWGDLRVAKVVCNADRGLAVVASLVQIFVFKRNVLQKKGQSDARAKESCQLWTGLINGANRQRVEQGAGDVALMTGQR